MSKKIFLFFLAFLLVMGCAAKKKSEEGPFSYKDKPINPAAIDTLYDSKNNILDLNAFQTNIKFGEWIDQPGWLIAEYEEDPVSGKIPFFAYKLLTYLEDKFLLQTNFNDGSIGIFDNILVVQKTGDRLSVLEKLGEGDRCNGGISDLRVEGDVLYYSINLTPADIMGLATEVKLDLTANEDLEDTADSCFAVGNYRYSLADLKREFLSIVFLADEMTDEKGWTERYAYQSCFNRAYNSYVRAGKTELFLKDLNEFAQKFQEECLKAKV